MLIQIVFCLFAITSLPPLLILYICQIVHLIFSDHINAYISLNVSSTCERQYTIFFQLKKTMEDFNTCKHCFPVIFTPIPLHFPHRISIIRFFSLWFDDHKIIKLGIFLYELEILVSSFMNSLFMFLPLFLLHCFLLIIDLEEVFIVSNINSGCLNICFILYA